MQIECKIERKKFGDVGETQNHRFKGLGQDFLRHSFVPYALEVQDRNKTSSDQASFFYVCVSRLLMCTTYWSIIIYRYSLNYVEINKFNNNFYKRMSDDLIEYGQKESESYLSIQNVLRLQQKDYQELSESDFEGSKSIPSLISFHNFIKDPEFQGQNSSTLHLQPEQGLKEESTAPLSSRHSQQLNPLQENYGALSTRQSQKKNKKIQKTPRQVTEHQIQRRKRQPYPTKNFLQTFKPCFLRYLRNAIGSEVFDSQELTSKLATKEGVNLKDFESLFNFPRFREIWQRFFAEGIQFRVVMGARLPIETKKKYFSRIHVFQEAFENGVFKKIN